MSPRPSMKKFTQKAAKAAQKVEQDTPKKNERLKRDNTAENAKESPEIKAETSPVKESGSPQNAKKSQTVEPEPVNKTEPLMAPEPDTKVKAESQVKETPDTVSQRAARTPASALSTGESSKRTASSPAPQAKQAPAGRTAVQTRENAFQLDDPEAYWEEEEESLENRFLTFHLAGEDYGIRVLDIIEIIGMQTITEIPDVPEAVRGLVNLRGHIIPVVDVRMRFELESIEYGERTSIIVVQLDDMRAGLIVDQVKEILDIPEEGLTQPSKVTNSKMRHFIEAIGRIGDDVKIILNLENLLFPEGRPKAA